MAVCNIFNALNENKTTGTFLTFSQYTEDMACWNSQSVYYRVVPSKFMAVELNESGLTNDNIAKTLQNYFENGCAVCRSNDNDWNPTKSSSLFWDTMFNQGLIDDNISNIKYVGDINIQSCDEHNGMTYSDIYCHIPSNEKQYTYTVNVIQEDDTISSGNYVEGYTSDELGSWGDIDPIINYKTYNSYNFDFDNKTAINASKYIFNSVIVLYDVYNKDEKIYSNIPMGIYITGSIYNEKIQNPVTKFVSNDDIYATGSSYGLRICTRYSSVNGDINVSIDNNYADLTRVLSQISVSQQKMDDIINTRYNYAQNYKELLSIFKNSRTNVPYIKDINGVDYWFINGKVVQKCLVPRICNNPDGVEQSYDIDDLSIDMDNVQVVGFDNNSLSIDINGNIIYDNGDVNITSSTSTSSSSDGCCNCMKDVYSLESFVVDPVISLLDPQTTITKILRFRILKNGSADSIVSPKEVSVDDNAVSFLLNEDPEGIYYEIPISINSSIVGENKYLIKGYNLKVVLKDNTELIDNPYIVFTYPSYFQLSSEDGFSPNNNDIILQNTRKLIKTYTNENHYHVYYAYPKSYGELTSISDSQGLEYIHDFTRTIETHNTAEYYVYKDNNPACVINYTLKFI